VSPVPQSSPPNRDGLEFGHVMATIVEWSRHNFPLEKTCKYLFVPVGVLPTCPNGIHLMTLWGQLEGIVWVLSRYFALVLGRYMIYVC